MLAERAAQKDGEIKNVLLAAQGSLGPSTEEKLRQLVMARAAFFERFQESDKEQMEEATQRRQSSLAPEQVAGALGLNANAVKPTKATQIIGASIGQDGRRKRIAGRLFHIETPEGKIAIVDAMFL